MICNAGLVNGLSEEIIFEHFQKFGELENILLLPGKSCSFISYKNIISAEEAYAKYNGKLNIAQDNKPIYILFCEKLPENHESSKIWDELPPDLFIIKDFITKEEEESLVQLFDLSNTENNPGHMKHRQVKHYGYEFNYSINNVDKNNPLNDGIPKQCEFLFKRLEQTQFKEFKPDQLTVNHYKPGQGIPPHIDTHSAFEDPFMSLSLQSDVIMKFKRGQKCLSVNLPRCSLAIISGESRYAWTHGITPRKIDIIAKSSGLSAVIRGTRISLTFRKILHGKCNCNFKDYCDSHCDEKEIESNVASKLEQIYVHNVYDKIATHFSDTRNKSWSNVTEFVNSFPFASVIIDVGCGNGKYLYQNTKHFKVSANGTNNLSFTVRYIILFSNTFITREFQRVRSIIFSKIIKRVVKNNEVKGTDNFICNTGLIQLLHNGDAFSISL